MLTNEASPLRSAQRSRGPRISLLVTTVAALGFAVAGCGHRSGRAGWGDPGPSKKPAAAQPAPAKAPVATGAGGAGARAAAAPQPQAAPEATPIAVAPEPAKPESAKPESAKPALPPPAARAYEPPMPPDTSPAGAPSVSSARAPRESGPRYAVRGVDPSDVLNVRAGPSSKDEVVGTIPPEARGVVGVGVRRQIGPSTWREVKYGTVRGWVNERFLVEERKSR